MAHQFHIVDVFAEERYAGNPLATVFAADDLEPATQQRIAFEFGFSETTFVVSAPEAGGDGTSVRIYTPRQELPFAGHPTLGTAWLLREHYLSGRPAEIRLALGVGAVDVAFAAEGGRDVAWLTAPPVTLGRTIAPERIAAALGLAAEDLADGLPAQHVLAGVEFVHVPLASEAALARMRLDPARFAPLAEEGFPSHVYAFARASAGATDLCARMQLYERTDPTRSVGEDPATGSATACLGAYLLEHTGADVGVRVAQGVEMGRPSLLRLDARGTPSGAVIRVGGCVVEVARGELL